MVACAYGAENGCHLLRFAITYPEVLEVEVFPKTLYVAAMSAIRKQIKALKANNIRRQ